MATYGQIRSQFLQLCPGASIDLIDGWLQDRYQQMLDRLEWDRTETRATIQTEPEYNTGTVAVAAGSIDLVLTGGTWTVTHDKRIFRSGDSPMYDFVFLGATTGKLSRPWEGATDAAAGYKLNRVVYTLPPDLRVLNEVRVSGAGCELDRWTMAEMNELHPERTRYGTPEAYVQIGDLIEFYPIPESAKGVILDYTAEKVIPGESGATLLPWIRPGALKAGVQADFQRWKENWAGGREFEMKFDVLMNDMLRIAAEREGPVQMRPKVTTTQAINRAKRTRF